MGGDKLAIGDSIIDYKVRLGQIILNLEAASRLANGANETVRASKYQGDAYPSLETFYGSYTEHLDKLRYHYHLADGFLSSAVKTLELTDEELAASVLKGTSKLKD